MSAGQNQREASRRRFIGGAGLLAVAAIAPMASAAGGAEQPQMSARLRRLIALYDRAHAAYERHIERHEEPAWEAWQAAVAAYPAESPPPHAEVATTFVNAFNETVRLSTVSVGAAGVARRVVSDPTWADMGDDDWRAAHRELAAAHDRRDAALAAQADRRKAFEAEARQRFNVDTINARGDALDDRRYRLWQATIAFPAAGLVDLVAKLDFSKRVDGEDEAHVDVFSAIVADVRSLAAREVH